MAPTIGDYIIFFNRLFFLSCTVIASIHFEPRVRRDKKRYWREDIPWIRLEPPGGSYDPKDALDALIKCIDRKISHYGHFGNEDVRLIIYYNMALLYNTPFIGALKYEPKTFQDVAISSEKYLKGKQIPFKRVYLLNVPENEVFEIYPKFERCN